MTYFLLRKMKPQQIANSIHLSLKRGWVSTRGTYFLVRYHIIKFTYIKLRAIFAISYLSTVGFCAVLVFRLTDANVVDKGYSDSFVTLGAVLAGMLAIVFAIRTVAIQHAASAQSALLFEIVARDRLSSLTYWYLAFLSLFYTGFGFFLKSFSITTFNILSNTLMSIIVLTLGISFFMISNQFTRLYDRVSPLRSLRLIKSDFYSRMDRISRKIEKLARKLAKEPSSAEVDRTLLAKAEARITLGRRIGYIFDDMAFLFDYHDKLKQNAENAAARMVLATIGDITTKYIELIMDSSVLVKSREPLYPVSDSQKLFSRVLERLVARGKKYILDQDDEGATKVLLILERLTIDATKIRFLGNKIVDNPVVHQIRYHVGLLIEYAVIQRHVETLFQSAGVLARIGEATARADLYLEAGSISQLLVQIANAGSALFIETIWREAVKCHCQVLRAFGSTCNKGYDFAISSTFNSMRMYFPSLFKVSESTIVLSRVSGQGTLATAFYVTARLIQFELTKMVKENSNRELHHLRVKVLMKEYINFLNEIAKSIKSADSHLTEEIAKSLYGPVNSFLAFLREDKDVEFQKECIKYTNSFLNVLSQFAENADKIQDNHSFDGLVEMAAKTGLIASENGNEEVAIKSIDTIESLSKIYMEKTKEKEYDLTAPRILQRACFIGILGLRKHQQRVVSHLKGIVLDFDKKVEELILEDFKEVDPSTRLPVHLIRNEVGRLYENCNEEKYDVYKITKSGRSRLYKSIECKDIDDFCMEFWGFKASEKFRSISIY